jgi:hypothetical protein
MEKLDIEFKLSETGMYSPWHLDIAHKYNVTLMVTCDTGSFVKIGNDIYKIRYQRDMYKLYQYVIMLEEMNDKGEASDEEVLKEIDDIVNNKNKDFYLEKCQPLDEFEKKIIELSNGKS